MRFANRTSAGRILATKLAPYQRDHPVVVGLARGGVPVAFEVAEALDAPLEVFVARKLGAPGQPEFAIGAIAPGVRVLNKDIIRLLGVSSVELDEIVDRETREMEARTLRYRGDNAPIDVQGREVILIDDGIATGATVRAAVRSLRNFGARRLVLATPTCAAETLPVLQAEADEVVCLSAPAQFYGVGVWYDDFSQTTDDEVSRLLRDARRRIALTVPHGDSS